MTQSHEVGSSDRPLRVAVIGSGPAGFYAAQPLLNAELTAEVDVFDRLPTPFGLVRGGVAPDHQSIKKVVRVYDKTAKHPGFRFFGNVELGRDLSVDDLREHYDQIVYAVGNELSRRLGIPGEGMQRCAPAAVFVGWYNGHPDYRHFHFDFSHPTAAVIGNGNVAVDIARILVSSPEVLAKTDIADYALEALRESRIEEVVMVGRRGPVQAAFSPAELKELTAIDSVDALIDPADVALDPISAEELDRGDKHMRRNVEMLTELAKIEPTKPRRIRFRFLLSPLEVLGDEEGGVRAVKLQRNRLVKGNGRTRVEATAETELLEVGLLFPAVGYQGKAIAGVPFDENKGRIANIDGRVTDRGSGEPLLNQYVVGWARSGPTGLIGSHKSASAEVAAHMLADLAADPAPARALPDRQAIGQLLQERNCSYVSFDDWRLLDAIEVERGGRRDAPRVKVTAVDEMLELVDKTR